MTVTFKPEGEADAISLFPVTKFRIIEPDKYAFAGRIGGNPLFYVQPVNKKIEVVSAWNKNHKVGNDYIWDYLMSKNHYGTLIADGVTYTETLVTYQPDYPVTSTGRACIMTMTFEIVSST